MPVIEPISNSLLPPSALKTLSDWLFSNFYQKPGYEGTDEGWDLGNLPTYPGQLSPDVNQTKLPQVWDSWQPWDAGTTALAQFIAGQGPTKPGQEDPRLAQLSRWGGGQGPGTQAMSNLMQFGAASEAGRPLANMAQFGVPSQAIGNLLAPILAGNSPTRYSAPSIPQRQVTRTEARPTR